MESERRRGEESDYRLGAWLVRPSFNQVIVGAEAQRLEPQVLRVLAVLAEHRGEVVSRDRLIARAWDNLAVTDDAITRCVSRLRSLFRAHPEGGVDIQTVAKRGYCLHVAAEAGHSPARPFLATPSWRRWAAAAVAVVLLLIAGALLVIRDRSDAIPEWEVRQVTAEPGQELYPALSADGRLLAYAAAPRPGEDLEIHVRRVGEQDSLRLTSHEARDYAPAWSPSGSRIAFVRELPGGCEVHVVPAAGGTAARVWTCRSATWTTLGWAGEDRLILSDLATRTSRRRLIILDLRTGAARPLTSPPADAIEDRAASVSPDGRTAAFARAYQRHRDRIMLVDLETGRERTLVADIEYLTAIGWRSDRELIVSTLAAGELRNLYRVRLATPAPERLQAPFGGIGRIAVSGDTLVAERHTSWSNLFELRLPDVREPLPLTRSTSLDLWPSYAPDGRRVAFVSFRSGSPEIWLAEGNAVRRLTSLGAVSIRELRWSPDGRRLLFSVNRGGSGDIALVDVGSGLVTAVTDGPDEETSPAWDSSGQSVLYAANAGGSWRVWRQTLATAVARPLTGPGYTLVRTAPGDAAIYLGRQDASAIERIGASGGKPAFVMAGTRSVNRFIWQPAGGRIFHVTQESQRSVALNVFEPTVGRSRRLARLERLHYDSDISVAPSLDRAAFALDTLSEADLVLLRPRP